MGRLCWGRAVHLEHRRRAFDIYSKARSHFIARPELLICLEEVLTDSMSALLASFMTDAEQDYNDASRLYAFWQNFPPEERGRSPRGDQMPWIEVGEHTIGTKLAREVSAVYRVRDTGFPTGADQRFVLSGPGIADASDGFTDTAWVCIDIKSVGPRDDFDHAVMSHNQVSGSGEWLRPEDGVHNEPMMAVGQRSSHPFYPALPPLLVLPTGEVAPTVTLALKPVYGMEPSTPSFAWMGQPLNRLHLVTIPNGLLLTQAPNYLAEHQGLLYPGKDDASKPPRKKRARVSFSHLSRIASWRYQTVWARSV